MTGSTHFPSASSRILRRREVQDRTSLPRSTLYELIAAGSFPKPVRLGPRAVGWLEAEVCRWIQQRAADRHTGVPDEDRQRRTATT